MKTTFDVIWYVLDSWFHGIFARVNFRNFRTVHNTFFVFQGILQQYSSYVTAFKMRFLSLPLERPGNFFSTVGQKEATTSTSHTQWNEGIASIFPTVVNGLLHPQRFSTRHPRKHNVRLSSLMVERGWYSCFRCKCFLLCFLLYSAIDRYFPIKYISQY